MMKKLIQKISLSLALTASIFTSVMADDVEIFFNTMDADEAGAPLVMFSLDYRPNLGANICNIGGCAYWDGYWDGSITPASADYDENMDLMAAAFTVADKDDGVINFLEMLRAGLRVVLYRVDGVKVGLMMNHDHVSVNSCTFPDDGSDSSCSNGGYIAMGFQLADGAASTTGGDDVLLDKLAAIPIPQGNLSHSYQGPELYFEFFRYLTGQGVYNGYNGRSDYDDGCPNDNLDDTSLPGAATVGCTSGSNLDVDVDSLISWDTSIIDVNAPGNSSDDVYISPFTDDGSECAGVYAINFMFGVSNQDSDSNDAIAQSKANGGMDGLAISNSTPFLDTIDWMHADGNATDNNRDLADGTYGTAPDRSGDQNVTSYFLYRGNVGNTMNGYANAGGSNAATEVTDDPGHMIEQLTNIFESIQRQNSTFEAPAVTVNSFSRLTHRDELYYALFAPEEQTDWPGNLKKYRLIEIPIDDDGDGITDRRVVTVGDSNDDPAVADQTELFLPTACSFWSTCDLADVQAENLDRNGDGTVDEDDTPDGDHIDWGGAAEQLTINRKVYTNTTDSGNVDLTLSANQVHEDNTSITADYLGITSATIATDMNEDTVLDAADIALQRTRLLRLARGVDPDDTSTPLLTMGDPIHARPTVIEYDSDVTSASNTGDNPDLAIAMTTNEGYFHLFNEETGEEYFSFIPEDLLDLVGVTNGPIPAYEELRNGSLQIAEGPNRYNTYGLDASPVIWPFDHNSDGDLTDDDDSVWAFLTQRRGGRNIYALDITDRDNPRLMWTIKGGPVDEGGDGDFLLMGQTWSEPTKAVIRKDVDGVETPVPVLIFGAGYDDVAVNATDLDHDDGYYTSDGVGNAIYIIEAETKNLLWTISAQDSADLEISQMLSSIPAKTRVLDIDEDNYVDRIYAVDVVGRVFRVDFDNNHDSNDNGIYETEIYGGGMVADLSETLCSTGPNDSFTEEERKCQRRFFNAPDITLMVGYPLSPYFHIALGSGYRPHPVTVKGQQNRFHIIFDHKVLEKMPSDGYGNSGTYTDEYGDTQDKTFNWEVDLGHFYDVTTLPNDHTTLEASRTAAVNALTADGIHGWYFDLSLDDTGLFDVDLNEHVLSESITLEGLTFVTTYLRDPSAVDVCSVDLGQGRLYIIDAFSGLPAVDFDNLALFADSENVDHSSRYLTLDRTGIPSDPLVVFRESDGEIVPAVVVGSDLPIEGGDGTILGNKQYRKTWWIDVQ